MFFYKRVKLASMAVLANIFRTTLICLVAVANLPAVGICSVFAESETFELEETETVHREPQGRLRVRKRQQPRLVAGHFRHAISAKNTMATPVFGAQMRNEHSGRNGFGGWLTS